MALSDAFVDLLRGGLPEVLDFGASSNPNAPNAQSNQYTERNRPVDAQAQATAFLGVDSKTLMIVGGIGLVVLLVVFMRR